MDSLTRFAQAQREIALSVGEPRRPKVIHHRCLTNYQHWLNALVMAATPRFDHRIFHRIDRRDDLQDPIADASRAILDVHIVLSREMADAGHYPAIDVEKSVSRLCHKSPPMSIY